MSRDLFTALMSRQPRALSDELPLVSVVTPTYNRAEFLPYLLYMFQYQDYPADRRELVILDDSPHSHAELVAELTRYAPYPERVRYIHLPERLPIGAKRNRLNALAQGEYIICMDDDDYYPADKIRYTVNEMRRHNALFAGCDTIPVWYSHINQIFMTASFGRKHVLNGTFAYHRNYLRNHRYDDRVTLGEEGSFTRGFTVPVLQLDPWRSILCVSHSRNTFDKDFVLASSKVQTTTLEQVVSDPLLHSFYQRLHQAPLSQQPDWGFFHRVVLIGENAALRQQLLDAGLPEGRLLSMAPQAHPRLTHMAVIQRAQQENWPNYLLLDSGMTWVRHQRGIDALNRLLRALPHIGWDGFHLGAELVAGWPLAQMPGVVAAHVQALPHLACCVNQPAYAALLARLAQASDADERLATADLRWFALYPGLFFHNQIIDGEPATARFFRKIGDVPQAGSQEFV